ncbi:hypothetical protein ES703_73679 [subsurface metagenome]
MRTIEAGNLLLQDLAVDIPEGRYEHLSLRTWGTSDTGQTGSKDNLGRIRVNLNGTDIISTEFEYLHQFTNMYFGLPEEVSAAAGPCSFSSLIPFSNRAVPNGLEVSEEDICQFFLTRDGVLNTTYAALNYELLGIETDAPQSYIQMFYDLTRQYSGSGQDVFDLKHENIGLIAVISDVLDRIMVTQDDEIIHNGEYDSLLHIADIFNEVEAATVGAVALDMSPGRDPLENLASKVGMQLSANAAGVANIWYLAYEFDAEKFDRTVAMAVAKIARKVSEKPPARRAAVARIAQARLGIAPEIVKAPPPRRRLAVIKRSRGRRPGTIRR